MRTDTAYLRGLRLCCGEELHAVEISERRFLQWSSRRELPRDSERANRRQPQRLKRGLQSVTPYNW
jgi:hypothetical protein